MTLTMKNHRPPGCPGVGFSDLQFVFCETHARPRGSESNFSFLSACSVRLKIGQEGKRKGKEKQLTDLVKASLFGKMTKSNVRTLNQRLEDHGIKFFPPSFCLTQEYEPQPFISPSFRFMEDTKNENWADVHFSGGVASQIVENHNTLFAGFLNPEGVAVWKVLSNFFFFFFFPFPSSSLMMQNRYGKRSTVYWATRRDSKNPKRLPDCQSGWSILPA